MKESPLHRHRLLNFFFSCMFVSYKLVFLNNFIKVLVLLLLWLLLLLRGTKVQDNFKLDKDIFVPQRQGGCCDN